MLDANIRLRFAIKTAWRRADFQLRDREAGKLIVENVATGTSVEVDLLEN